MHLYFDASLKYLNSVGHPSLLKYKLFSVALYLGSR